MKLSALAIIAAIATVLGFNAPTANAMPRVSQAPISAVVQGDAATPVHYRRYRHRHYRRYYRPRYRYYRRYYRPRYRYRRVYRSRRHCHGRYCHRHRYSRRHRH
ncbi:MAG: hypothetical protein AAGM04_11750 [Pseudomonadota bacterium]